MLDCSLTPNLGKDDWKVVDIRLKDDCSLTVQSMDEYVASKKQASLEVSCEEEKLGSGRDPLGSLSRVKATDPEQSAVAPPPDVSFSIGISSSSLVWGTNPAPFCCVLVLDGSTQTYACR